MKKFLTYFLTLLLLTLSSAFFVIGETRMESIVDLDETDSEIDSTSDISPQGSTAQLMLRRSSTFKSIKTTFNDKMENLIT